MPAGGRVRDALQPNGEIPDAKALEYRAEVDSLEALQAERRTLIPRFSELAAKFKGGNQASADTKRKQHRALIAQKILAEMKPEAKPSEAALERMANAHIDHIAYCNTLEKEYAEYVVLDFKIRDIQEKIDSRNVELYCYNAELKMQA